MWFLWAGSIVIHTHPHTCIFRPACYSLHLGSLPLPAAIVSVPLFPRPVVGTSVAWSTPTLFLPVSQGTQTADSAYCILSLYLCLCLYAEPHRCSCPLDHVFVPMELLLMHNVAFWAAFYSAVSYILSIIAVAAFGAILISVFVPRVMLCLHAEPYCCSCRLGHIYCCADMLSLLLYLPLLYLTPCTWSCS